MAEEIPTALMNMQCVRMCIFKINAIILSCIFIIYMSELKKNLNETK